MDMPEEQLPEMEAASDSESIEPDAMVQPEAGLESEETVTEEGAPADEPDPELQAAEVVADEPEPEPEIEVEEVEEPVAEEEAVAEEPEPEPEDEVEEPEEPVAEAEAVAEELEPEPEAEVEEAEEPVAEVEEAAEEPEPEAEEPVAEAEAVAEEAEPDAEEPVAEAEAVVEEAEPDADEPVAEAEEASAAETEATAVELPEPALDLDEGELGLNGSDGQGTEELAVAEAPERRAAEPDDGRQWYVVHCYSGYENKVRHNLEQRIETMDMKGKIFDVVVPTEEEMEVREGKRRTVERRVFPGYILVQMIMDEDSWYVVRNTPGVTGFVGMGNEPTPLRPEEVSQIVKRMEAEAPRIKVTYNVGQKVRIIDGPFNDFIGTVDDIDMDKAKVRVMVSFFGRETPVELDFLQVEKA